MSADVFFTRVGKGVVIAALVVVVAQVVLFTTLAVRAMADPHPAFTLPPDSSYTKR